MIKALLVASLCTTHVFNYPSDHVSVAGPMCVGDFIAPVDNDANSGSSQIQQDQATIILQTPAPSAAIPSPVASLPQASAPAVSQTVSEAPQAVPDPTPSKANPDGLYYPQNYVKLGGQIEQKTEEKQVAEVATKPVKNFFRERKRHHRTYRRHRVHQSSRPAAVTTSKSKRSGGFWWWEKRKR